MPSGGFRPNAPQNKFGVSATGGNGSKDGQPVRLAPGGAWGSRTAMATQQGGAAMKNSEDTPVPALPPITSLTAPTERPNEPITTGITAGAGAGPEALMLPPNLTPDNIEFNSNIRAYSQSLYYVASLPGTSAETKQAIATLLRESDL